MIGPSSARRTARPIEVLSDPDGSVIVSLDGKVRKIWTKWQPGQVLFEGQVDDSPVTIQLDRKGVAWIVHKAGAAIEMRVVTRAAGELAALMPVKVPPDMSKYLLSPMPGLLVSVAVRLGQTVKSGEELAVVEAMKMENVLRAERDGTVAKIAAEAGQSHQRRPGHPRVRVRWRIVLGPVFRKSSRTSICSSRERGRRPRILVVTQGPDGDDGGARAIATGFAEVGFRRRCRAALPESGRGGASGDRERRSPAIGVSTQSSEHESLVPALRAALKQQGGGDIVVATSDPTTDMGTVAPELLRNIRDSRKAM